MLVVELWPADRRPYIGGSQTNSVLELAFGYNGLGRLTGDEVGSVGGGGRSAAAGARPGLTRLFDAEIGGPASWLLPAALVLLGVLLWRTRRAPRTDPLRAAAVLWGGWLLVTGRGVQPDGRHLPRLLHGGAGAGDRRAGRHRRR